MKNDKLKSRIFFLIIFFNVFCVAENSQAGIVFETNFDVSPDWQSEETIANNQD